MRKLIHKHGTMARLFTSLAALISVAQAVFTGTITMSDTTISATDVTYTFSLRFEQNIPDTGRIVIRFPDDYVDLFTITNSDCAPVSGFATGTTDIDCEYVSEVRLLTINGGFPTTFTEIVFTVAGVTNPAQAATTESFTISSEFITSGSDYVQLEPSSDFIIVTPTAGTLSNESLSLSDGTVGVYSALTIGLTVQHAIPATGSLEIEFPKWNAFAPFESQRLPFVATSTSPGIVQCASGLT